MAAILVTWIANSLAIYCVAYLMVSVDVASLREAFIAGAILSLINAIVKPVVVLLTLPLTVVTLGLFYFVITAFCLWLTSKIYPDFAVQGFWATLFASILVGLFSAVIHSVLSKATTGSRQRR